MRCDGPSLTAAIRTGIIATALAASALLAGCATQCGVSEIGSAGIVQPGDNAYIHFLCRLNNGDVAASTDRFKDAQPKSNIYVMNGQAGPFSITARPTDVPFQFVKEEPFETEILNRLAGVVTGMKTGETLQVELAAADIPARDKQNYTVRVPRVRTRPKEMHMTVDDYRGRTRKSPEAGQAFSYDPAFPGRVESVTDQDVVIRFVAGTDKVIQTPFGPGTIREEEKDYKVDIDVRKGGLVRTGGMIGRIVEADEKFITIDYRNPFGGETLNCDVSVQRVEEVKSVKKGSGG